VTEKSGVLSKQDIVPPISEKEREALVERINEFVDSMNTGLSFRIDEDTGKEVVTIYDTKTGDTLRQFPSEDMLDVLKRLSEYSTGLIAESV
jgi:flagellar protein FlaG